MIEITRRYRFPAAHILSVPCLSAAQNRATYGKCANPNGHGHNYEAEITVRGPIDARTGRIIDPDLLDRIFDARVASRFARTLLNEDAAFSERVPTAENIALVVHEILGGEIARRSGAEVVRVRIVETRHNACISGSLT